MARPQAIMPVQRTRNFIKMALYGYPGAGKSVLAGTSPKALILCHDMDEVSSAKEHGSKADAWEINTVEDLEEAYNYVRHDGLDEYEWVWIDNLSLLQDRLMDAVMEALVLAKPHRNRWVPDQPEYLQVQNQISTYVRNFVTLPIHFGWTAHVMEGYDSEAEAKLMPLVQGGQGNLSQKLCGWGNVTAYMYATGTKEGGERRRITVGSRSRYYAKSRFRGLQGEMIAPTIPRIEDAVRKYLPTLGQRDVPRRATASKKAAGSKKAPAKAVATTKKTTRRAS